jgi:hypothetical protein
MEVYYGNCIYKLDMTFLLYQHLKETSPDCIVELMTMSDSTYQQIKKVPIRDVFDYSVERNRIACGYTHVFHQPTNYVPNKSGTRY